VSSGEAREIGNLIATTRAFERDPSNPILALLLESLRDYSGDAPNCRTGKPVLLRGFSAMKMSTSGASAKLARSRASIATICTVLPVWGLAAPALGHHSFAATYDAKQPITIESVVSKMSWQSACILVRRRAR
jgi:hypothetical protein